MMSDAPERIVRDPAQLAHQARGRDYTADERAMATAMARAFASGEHDFTGVARWFQEWGIVRPSGETGAWTLEVLEAELHRVNASLDAAYAQSGFGA